MSNTSVYEKTSQIAHDIVIDVMPQATGTKPAYPEDRDRHLDHAAWLAEYKAYSAWMVEGPGGAQAHLVKSAQDVQVGDLVFVTSESKRRGWWSTTVYGETTMVDLAKQRTDLAVVVAKTGKMFTYQSLSYAWWNYDLATLDLVTDPELVQRYQTRTSGTTNAAMVVRVGTYAEITEAIAAHPKFDQWAALHTQAVAEMAASNAERDQEAQQKAAAVASLITQAALLNEAVGLDVAHVNDYAVKVELNLISRSSARLAQDLVTLALTGRLADGAITEQQHAQALAVLGSE